MTHYETQLWHIIKNDNHIMSVLQTVEHLKLNDAWVAAGLIRNRVWDSLHNKMTPLNDIDVIYFDSTDTSLKTERKLEEKLINIMPGQPWSVKNQARMHLKNDFDCFRSSYDGVAHFPETPTAIAVRQFKSDLKIMAPYGLEDLFEKTVKPTPSFQSNSKLHAIYRKRMKEKEWTKIWSDLCIED